MNVGKDTLIEERDFKLAHLALFVLIIIGRFSTVLGSINFLTIL